ncbi:hypothetical protein AMECASPLE_037095 [Ameca splendens]|uniref:Uncharacterized protein n=1 Tax=Ameca splendens TaxID=208324 RepID=A0ABV1A4U0_9TELE
MFCNVTKFKGHEFLARTCISNIFVYFNNFIYLLFFHTDDVSKTKLFNLLLKHTFTRDLQLPHGNVAASSFRDPSFTLSCMTHLFLENKTPVVRGGVSASSQSPEGNFYPTTDKSCLLLNLRKAT